MKSDIEKQRHSSRTTKCQTLRGMTMKKQSGGDNIRNQYGNDATLEINVFQYVFFVQALLMPRSKNSSGVYRPKYQNLHFSLVSLSPRTRSRPGAERIRQGEGCLRPPEDGARTKRFDREIQLRESHTEAGTKKIPGRTRNKMIVYIFILVGFIL